MPNWRKDKKKSRVIQGKCAIERCHQPQTIIYYDYGLCDTHFNYYFDDDMPTTRLKDILGIPVSEEERALVEAYLQKQKLAKKLEKELDEWETEMFSK